MKQLSDRFPVVRGLLGESSVLRYFLAREG